MRIDKLLWNLRLVRTRGIAQQLVGTGHIRRNGQRVLRASQDVAEGDTLTIPLPAGVRVIRISALPARRGPAAEALACYEVLDPARQTAIAGGKDLPAERGQHP